MLTRGRVLQVFMLCGVLMSLAVTVRIAIHISNDHAEDSAAREQQRRALLRSKQWAELLQMAEPIPPGHAQHANWTAEGPMTDPELRNALRGMRSGTFGGFVPGGSRMEEEGEEGEEELEQQEAAVVKVEEVEEGWEGEDWDEEEGVGAFAQQELRLNHAGNGTGGEASLRYSQAGRQGAQLWAPCPESTPPTVQEVAQWSLANAKRQAPARFQLRDRRRTAAWQYNLAPAMPPSPPPLCHAFVRAHSYVAAEYWRQQLPEYVGSLVPGYNELFTAAGEEGEFNATGSEHKTDHGHVMGRYRRTRSTSSNKLCWEDYRHHKHASNSLKGREERVLCWPAFTMLGFPKCGTTQFHGMLRDSYSIHGQKERMLFAVRQPGAYDDAIGMLKQYVVCVVCEPHCGHGHPACCAFVALSGLQMRCASRGAQPGYGAAQGRRRSLAT